MRKIAVVLFNLGGPDSKEAIEPFLFNFFMDKNIVGLPLPIRYLLAKKISKSRSKKEAGESYGELGNSSPLLKNTEKQARALQKLLSKKSKEIKYKTFVSMRYWQPRASETIRSVQKWGADKIIILPLYPQFSTTTSGSSLEEWNKEARKAGLDIPVSGLCCYPANDGFIKASADNIKKTYDKARKDGHKNPRILFSAHGLPEKIIKSGDSYQYQCENTAQAIAQKLPIKNPDWAICYQSRVGPLKWIGPSIDEELVRAARDNVAVVVYPHAFTQEHVETLVELDIEYKEEAKKLCISGYYRAQTVGTNPAFIKGLADMVLSHTKKKKIAAEGGRACPQKFKRCCMR